MKFTINREHFNSALQLVSSVVSNRKTMPILQNVLLETKDDSVFLTTTNLDLGINCSVKANIHEEGSVTLPVKELTRIVRDLADIEVNVEASDKSKVSISTRGSTFNLIGIDSKEYPPLPSLDKKDSFKIDRESLLEMLKSVSYAQSLNEERYMLKGVFFKKEESDLSLVATDGRRLAVATTNLKETEKSGSCDFILPSMTVAELERLPQVGSTIQVSYTDRQVQIELEVAKEKLDEQGFKNSISLISKVVEGKYPNFKQVIPKENFNNAVIERELMLECVSRASLISDERITLRIKSKEMEITGQSIMGDSCEKMPIEYEGEEATVSFNPKFIQDPLRAVKKDNIMLEFRDDMSPGVFKSESKQDNLIKILCVVMPIRTD